MRSRAQTSEQAETVNRRLRLLSAELSGIRPAVEESGPDEPGLDEPHTHLRELRPVLDDGVDAHPSDGHHPGSLQTLEPETSVPSGGPRGIPRENPVEPPPLPRPGRHAARRRTSVGWVDLSAFRGRVALTPTSLAVIAVVIAVGLGITAWWVIRDDPGVPVAVPTSGESLTTPVASAAAPVPGDGSSGDESGAGEVVVDVAGKVRHPGIVVLAPGSRVIDAIKAAGGARRGADLSGLNRARPVQDGEQIVVGVPAPPGVAASAAPSGGASDSSTGELVSLNTATTTELETLPGVGPVTAAAIVDWRETNGGFASVDQLLEIDGIGEKTLAQLAPHVTL